MAKKNPISTKNPFKIMYKGTSAKKKDGMHRPEGAGNFDNMDDYNIVESIALNEGTIQDTPTEHDHITNKEYVDGIATRSVIQLFLTKDSSDVTDYFDLDTSPDTSAQQDITTTISGSSTGTVASHVSKLNDAIIAALELIESGVYFCHMHPSSTANKNTFLSCEFYLRNSGGTETLIGTTEEIELGTSEGEEEMHLQITNDTAWTSTDRFVMKTLCRNANSSSKDITIRMKDDTFSRVEFPGFIAPTFVPDHTIASHSDTTATGAELETLTDNSMADTLHRHSELSASDGSPDAALSVDTSGKVGIGTASPDGTVHAHTATAGVVAANTDADDLVVENDANGGIHILVPDASDANIMFGSPTDNTGALLSWNHTSNLFRIFTNKAGADITFETGNSAEAIRILDSGNVGIGITAPAAQLHVDQASTTGAVPVLYLDQADLSEEMIEFNTTIGTGNAIEAIAAKTLTTTHFIKVTIPGGLTRYIPVGTIA